MECNPKIVVFDLDETLGYFVEFGMFWDALKNYCVSNGIDTDTGQKLFNDTLDLYPEFLRPNILNILKYLVSRKNNGTCNKVMIYTNNQGPREWTEMIVKYFEHKIESKIIDQIIAAFKVNGKQVEICRTTHSKTYKDFLRCTKVSPNADICFLDDLYHPHMKHDKIYYINVKKYEHNIRFDEMITRFIRSSILIIPDQDKFRHDMTEYMKYFKFHFVQKSPHTFQIDKIVGKKILQHLHFFFGKNKHNVKGTRRNMNRLKNKTVRKYRRK